MTKKFSQFVEDAVIQQTDIVVGLRSGVNTQFNFPGDGIADPYGNWIVKWQPYNSVDRNYILFTGSPQGIPVSMIAQGVDADLALVISSKNNGNLNLISPNAGNINLSIGGSGNVNVSTNAGLFYINNTTGINAVLDEDDLASNSATAVPTQQSVKAYVDSHLGGLPFVNVTTSTYALSIDTTFYTTYAGLSAMTLPITAAEGDLIRVIAGPLNNTFQIKQNFGQKIYFGSQLGTSIVTTTGTGGSLTSTDPGTVVELMCVETNFTWQVLFCQQNLIGV